MGTRSTRTTTRATGLRSPRRLGAAVRAASWKDVTARPVHEDGRGARSPARTHRARHATLIVMSDHGFAPYHRKFSLNTWLLDEGLPGAEAEGQGTRARGSRGASEPTTRSIRLHRRRLVEDARLRDRLQRPLLEPEGARAGRTRPRTKTSRGSSSRDQAAALLARDQGQARARSWTRRTDKRVVLRADLAADVYQRRARGGSPRHARGLQFGVRQLGRGGAGPRVTGPRRSPTTSAVRSTAAT